MKIKLELVINEAPDGQVFIFLNHWDTNGGDDLCAEIKDGELHLEAHRITLSEFVDAVKATYEGSF